MNKTLHYLFDPLCGWCYAIMPAVSRLSDAPDVDLKLLPTGLFADRGSRPMTDDFAAYAWSNDQSIARLTGQSFTEAYRHSVLGNHQQRFDSGPATLALTAVASTAPQREHEALKAIQLARFVDGLDVTSPASLAGILERLSLDEAVAMIANPNASLQQANRNRIARAQALLQEFGARGVPTLILESDSGLSRIDTQTVFANPGALTDQVQAA